MDLYRIGNNEKIEKVKLLELSRCNAKIEGKNGVEFITVEEFTSYSPTPEKCIKYYEEALEHIESDTEQLKPLYQTLCE